MLALCRGKGEVRGAPGRYISKALVPSDAVRQLFEDLNFFFNGNLNLFDAVGALRNIVASLIT